MENEINEIRNNFVREIFQAETTGDLKELGIKYLGRKGILTEFLKKISEFPQAQRPALGKSANRLKEEIKSAIQEKEVGLASQELGVSLEKEKIDLSLPGHPYTLGKEHPLTQVLDTVCNIFFRLGFGLAEGPEVEDDYHNFEALNFPPDHPARDMQATFFLSGGKKEQLLLRTHTSPVQIRTMEAQKPPVKVIIPGKVYRHDLDVSHTPMFHQVEGLWVEEGINFSHLKGILSFFAREMFGQEKKIRFRPSFFPFTEPSLEVDISCGLCQGKGCAVCKNTGWVEILGAGMIHPQVFRSVGYDPQKYTGLAFGLGIERVTLLKYGIDDIRLFFENDLRFLEQF